MLITCFISMIYAQTSVEVLTMKMVDGVEANIAFFKDWKTADAFMKQYTPQSNSVLINYTDGKIDIKDYRKSPEEWIKSPVGFDAKNENEPGDLINKDYKPNENEYADLILGELKSRGCKYSIAFADLGDKYVRYMNTDGGKKLRVNRYNYYSSTNKDYLNFIAKKLEKEQKSSKVISDVTRSLFAPFVEGAESASHKNETSEQTLYRLRHETHEITHIGTRNTGGTQIIQWRYIYRDDGRKVVNFIVDLDGNIRDEVTWEIAPAYSISKEMRALAMKSLE